MKLNSEKLRRTGRTQKMLEDVKDALLDDQQIYVACGNRHSKHAMLDRLHVMLGPRDEARWSSEGVAFIDGGKVRGSVTFVLVPSDFLDMATGHVMCRDNVRVFADHQAIESAMPWALQQWLTYSNPFVDD